MTNSENFQVSGKTFSQLMKSGLTQGSSNPFYCIPRYQRQYTWETQQALQLLGDVYDYFANAYNNSDDAYEKFIGSFMLVERENSEEDNTSPRLVYDVVDGQQRITTICLIVAAGLYRLLELGACIFDEAHNLLEIDQDESLKKDFKEKLTRAICKSLPGYIQTRVLMFSGKPGFDTDSAPRVYREREDAVPAIGKPKKIELDSIETNSISTIYGSPSARFFTYYALASYRYLTSISKNDLSTENFYKTTISLVKRGKDFLKSESSPNETYLTNYECAYKFLVELGNGMIQRDTDKYPFNSKIPEESMFDPLPLSDTINYNFCSQDELRNFQENWNDLLKIINNSKSEKIKNSNIPILLNSIIRIISYLEYLTTRVNIAVISGTRNTAFDIFETLNTAGQPLDSIETFIPEIYQTIYAISSDQKNKDILLERKHSFGILRDNNIEEIIKKIQDIFSIAKNRTGVSQVIIWFALICFGRKVGKRFSVQRWELKKAFDLFIGKSLTKKEISKYNREYTWQKVHEFTSLLLVVAYWWALCYGSPSSNSDIKKRFTGDWLIQDKLLPIPDNKEEFTDAQKKDLNTINFCLAFLTSANQSVSVGLAGRYYIQYFKNPTSENFLELTKSIKAIAAFTALWLSGETGSTQYAETQRRTMSRPSDVKIKNHKQELSNLSYFAQYENQKQIDPNFRITAESIMSSFVTGYEAFNNSFSLDTWTTKLPDSKIADKRKAINRFILILYWHCSENNKRNKLGLRNYIMRPVTNFLTGEYWSKLSELELEHIVPIKCDKWHIGIQQDGQSAKRILNELGNTTLLPKKLNQYASNNDWEYKKLLYSMLSARSEVNFEAIWKQADSINTSDTRLTKKDKNAIKKQLADLNEDFDEANTFLVESLLSVTQWDCNLIEARTKAIAATVWPLLSSWLGKEEKFDKKIFRKILKDYNTSIQRTEKYTSVTPSTKTNNSVINKFTELFPSQIIKKLSNSEFLIDNQFGYLHIYEQAGLITLQIINRTGGKRRIREFHNNSNFTGSKEKFTLESKRGTEQGKQYITNTVQDIDWLIAFSKHLTKLFM